MSSRRAWTQALGQTVAPQKPASKRSTGLRAIARAQVPSLSTADRHKRFVEDIAQIERIDEAIPLLQCYDIVPVPKPRMSQRDAWEKRPSVLRYRAYCDELRLMGVRLPHAYRLEFVLPMPDGWTDEFKARMCGQPHLIRPDSSNLIKAIEDAVVPKDEVLHTIGASKRWGRVGRIVIHKLPASTNNPTHQGNPDVLS